MRLRTLLWLTLFPLVAVSAATRLGLQSESHAARAKVGATRAPDLQDAVRPAALVAMQIVTRPSSHHGAGAAGSIRPGPPSQGIRSREVECTPVRLAALATSHAVAAHGPLIHFPTAPPIHG